MVLNDGTTWTDLDGCMIVEVETDEDYDTDVREHELRDLSESTAFQLKPDGPTRLFKFLTANGFELKDSKTNMRLSSPPGE